MFIVPMRAAATMLELRRTAVELMAWWNAAGDPDRFAAVAQAISRERLWLPGHPLFGEYLLEYGRL